MSRKAGYMKAYGVKNRTRLRLQAAVRRAKNPDWQRNWRAANPERVAIYNARTQSKRMALRQSDPVYRERMKLQSRFWRSKNPEKIRVYNIRSKSYKRTWAKNDPRKFEKGLRWRTANPGNPWKAKNRELYLAGRRKNERERRLRDPAYRARKYLSSRIWDLVRKAKGRKSTNTVALLGCSLPSFILYLESKFEPGMSWENYGKGCDKWNIDHIMPCAIFDLTKPEHQRRCFHFSNLQPLWEKKNGSKGAKVTTNQFQLL